MKMRGGDVLLGLLLTVCAAVAAPEPVEVPLKAQSGQPISAGLFPSLKNGCERAPLAEVRFLDTPKHGDIAVVRARLVGRADGPCPGLDYTAQRVVYRPAFGFAGTDGFSYEVKLPTGEQRAFRVRVDVRDTARRPGSGSGAGGLDL